MVSAAGAKVVRNAVSSLSTQACHRKLPSRWPHCVGLWKISRRPFLEARPGISLIGQSIKESNDMESFASTTLRCFRMTLIHRVKTVFDTSNYWHLALTRLRRRTRRASLVDFSNKDFITKIHQSIHEVASMSLASV